MLFSLTPQPASAPPCTDDRIPRSRPRRKKKSSRVSLCACCPSRSFPTARQQQETVLCLALPRSCSTVWQSKALGNFCWPRTAHGGRGRVVYRARLAGTDGTAASPGLLSSTPAVCLPHKSRVLSLISSTIPMEDTETRPLTPRQQQPCVTTEPRLDAAGSPYQEGSLALSFLPSLPVPRAPPESLSPPRCLPACRFRSRTD